MSVSTQNRRFLFRSAFFLLFLLAPPLNIFRFDLIEHHFIFLSVPWTLGTQNFMSGEMSVTQITWNMLIRFLLPITLIVSVGIFIAWKWGRVYCGWLCPHFSMVELINALMRRASGKLSIWDKKQLPVNQQDGVKITPQKQWWWLTAIVVFMVAFTWSVALLTYLLPPTEIYHNLIHFSLSRNQSLFIAVATILFMIDFTLARHLFCRFGCAIGVFQSLAWMANKQAMVVGFNRGRAKACISCDASCEHACPMRLKPRKIKRKMFTCTQCMQCIDACDKVQAKHDLPSLLKMVDNECALDVSARNFGMKADIPKGCYDSN